MRLEPAFPELILIMPAMAPEPAPDDGSCAANAVPAVNIDAVPNLWELP